MFQILETDFAKRLWLKNREAFCTSTVIERSGRSRFILYTGRMMGKEQQVLDEKWITDFAEAICAKREYHIRWNYSVEKEEQDYLVYITGEWEEMKVPLTIRISPLVYDAAKPENRSCSQSFLRRNVQRINIFRLKHIWQNNFYNPQISGTDSFYGGI